MGIIERIWVKVDNETYPNWYELDYLACGIEKGTCINVLNTFMSYNTTVGDLLHSMNCHLQDKLHYEKYDIMKSDVNFTLNTVFSEEIYLEEPDEAPLGRGHFADRR
jgi:hypothetical protein